MPLGEGVKTIGQRLTDQHDPLRLHWQSGIWMVAIISAMENVRKAGIQEYWYDMRCYLEELTDEERMKSRKRATAFEPDMTEGFTYAHRCCNRAIRFLEQYSDQDFFLTVSLDEPHGPSLCPPPFNHMYDGFSFDDNEGFHDDLDPTSL